LPFGLELDLADYEPFQLAPEDIDPAIRPSAIGMKWRILVSLRDSVRGHREGRRNLRSTSLDISGADHDVGGFTNRRPAHGINCIPRKRLTESVEI